MTGEEFLDIKLSTVMIRQEVWDLCVNIQKKHENYWNDRKISEFLNLLGLKDRSKYSQLPVITKELMKKVFEIKEEKSTKNSSQPPL